MKLKREIEVAVCDFCRKDAAFECSICGKDICYNHDLTLHIHFKEYGEGYSVLEFAGFVHSTAIVKHFCPNHLTDELNKFLIQSLR